MNFLDYKPEISATFQQVRRFSFDEKQEASLDNDRINKFLDSILEFKRVFSAKTSKINSLVIEIEKITWYNNLDNESLQLINDLISSLRDLHSSLLRQYISLNLIRTKGIAKNEISNFKKAIDDLKETANDLESAFFFLPNLPEFNEVTKELSLI